MSKNFEKIRVKETAIISDAMKKLNAEAMQIILVADDNNRLLGTITDGDIRRGLLNAVQLTDEVKKIMNTSPKFVTSNVTNEEKLAIMKRFKIHHLPVLDDDGVILSLEMLDDVISTPQKDNLVVLMAGGLGRRLGDLTKNCPKPMLRIGTRPILETILLSFIDQGFSNFLFSVNYKSEVIEEYFGNGSQLGVTISYLKEPQPMGTAGALSLMKDPPSMPMIVMNGDVLTNIDFTSMLKYHVNNNGIATMAVREYDLQIPYGVVNTTESRIKNIDEKPIKKFFVNAGIYVLNPESLSLIPENSYYDMPTLINNILEKDGIVSSFPVHEYWLDIGRVNEFEKAQDEFSDNFR